MTPERKAAVVALALITLTFGVGGALLGEVFGSSGDSDQTFIDHFASSRNRGIDIAGSALLIAAGVAFLVLAGHSAMTVSSAVATPPCSLRRQPFSLRSEPCPPPRSRSSP